MGRCVTLSLLAFALAVGAPARAAILDGINGQVLVNRGGTYRIVKEPMELKAGESVLANPGGSAVVSYTDGCNVPVAPGSIVAVAAASPCAAAMSHDGAAPAGVGGSSQTYGFNGVDGTTLGVGALVVGGVVGAAALIAVGRDRDQPASP